MEERQSILDKLTGGKDIPFKVTLDNTDYVKLGLTVAGGITIGALGWYMIKSLME